MAKRRKKAEDRLRERAERLWREDGSPHGRMDEYVERARELLAIEAHPAAGLLPNPMTQHGGATPLAGPVEEAALMENLGEFPSRLTDQGDRSPVPMARRKAQRAPASG